MKLNKDKILAEVKALLKDEMIYVAYDAWIKDLEIKSIDDEKIVLITHSKEQQDAIKRKFFDLFLNVFKMVLKKDYEMEVIAEPKEVYTAIRMTSIRRTIKYPLIIHGKNNTDKKYLVTTLQNEFKTIHEIIRISCNNFIKEIINGVNTNTLIKIHDKFKNLDMIIIEDIQNIVGKNRVQKELYYITKYFIENNKKIIFTSELNIEELEIDDKLKELLLGKFVKIEEIKEILKKKQIISE